MAGMRQLPWAETGRYMIAGLRARARTLDEALSRRRVYAELMMVAVDDVPIIDTATATVMR